jgi:DHA1 family 2-module integral membrane pump EmrD-like MFS transporter
MSRSFNHKEITLISLLISVLFFARFAISMFTPALPNIVHGLHSNLKLVQMSVMIYVLCVGLFQPIFGPLSDSIGRRTTLLIGGLFFIVGSLLAAHANSISALLISRAIQGIGGSACPAMVKTMACDYFTEKRRLGLVLSIITTAGTVFIAIAPAVGGFVLTLSHWHGIFLLLACFAAIVEVACFFFLPETHLNRRRFSLKHTLKDYQALLKNHFFVSLLLTILFIYSCELLYLSIAPFIFQEHFNMSAESYGSLILLPPIGFLCGIQLGVLSNRRIGARITVRLGVFFIFLAASLLLILGIWQINSILSSITGIVLAMFGVGFTFNTAVTDALHPVSQRAGSAVALLGIFQMSGSSLFAILLSHFNVHSARGLGGCFLTVCALASLSLYSARRAKMREQANVHHPQ